MPSATELDAIGTLIYAPLDLSEAESGILDRSCQCLVSRCSCRHTKDRRCRSREASTGHRCPKGSESNVWVWQAKTFGSRVGQNSDETRNRYLTTPFHFIQSSKGSLHPPLQIFQSNEWGTGTRIQWSSKFIPISISNSLPNYPYNLQAFGRHNWDTTKFSCL